MLIMVGLGAGSRAQLMDSLSEILHSRRSLDLRIESRNSFIDNRLISVTGIRLGVAFRKSLRLGGGISWINSVWSDNEVGQGDRLQYLKFIYLSYYADFVFHKTKRWQLSVPIQFGGGLAWLQDDYIFRWKKDDPKYLLILYEPGITVQYKIFRWAGIGADIAYRFAAVKKFGGKLNSPTYSLKAMIWIDQLYFLLFPSAKLTGKYGPAHW
jgi:hypothetical protein